MKYVFRGFFAVTLITAFMACKPRKETKEVEQDNPALKIYRASVTSVNDLVHTSLELEPDFEKRELKGKATILLKPHFYPTDTLTLNAQYMRIESVKIIEAISVNDTALNRQLNGYSKSAKRKIENLNYTYDSLFLRIKLNRTYTKDETYAVIIDYVAQPESVKQPGSAAINDAKGLYFINHDGKIPDKPVQMWTQGETQSASCWFPTIDAPNQKSKQDLTITVPEQYKTISNGLLVSSNKVGGNKRKDVWVQDLPHSPYLFALVVGDFAEVKDKWRDKDVNYYVEHAYEPYARMVFGNTPKMMEFYSNILQVPYPWDKFHQVVVRDFVSGAMENTGCVVHYDKLQHNRREHLDNTCEDIVAHELFHHWFGDLVTSESWSNLPLNESFATYGEYLWDEHQYGRDEADVDLRSFHQAYMDESEYKSENLVRYFYEDKEDMFDAHSYQKGGSVLHMLRKYVGDEAFFASLKLYLTNRAYKNAELADLRLAFEEITGEDLNWFFNQWFLDKGHPDLKVYHQTYNGSGAIYGITVVQSGKLFRLPVDVDIYTQKGRERHRIIIEKDSQTFGIPCADKPLCVIFDAENQLFGGMEETKTREGWEAQLRYAPISAKKILAVKQLLNLEQDKVKNMKYCLDLLNDSFWNNRATALKELYKQSFTKDELSVAMDQVKDIALKDPKAAVRKETIDVLRISKDSLQLQAMLEDSSYEVVKKSLSSLMLINKRAAYAYADRHRGETAASLQEGVFITIGKISKQDELEFFVDQVKKGNARTVVNGGVGLFYYMTNNRPDQADQVINRLTAIADDKAAPVAAENAVKALNIIRSYYYYQLYYYSIFYKDKKSKKAMKSKIQAVEKVYNRLESVLKNYKVTEED